MTNRVTPYEAGWLSMLVERGLCSSDQARAAMNRVAHAAIEEMERRRAERRQKRSRKRRREDE